MSIMHKQIPCVLSLSPSKNRPSTDNIVVRGENVRVNTGNPSLPQIQNPPMQIKPLPVGASVLRGNMITPTSSHLSSVPTPMVVTKPSPMNIFSQHSNDKVVVIQSTSTDARESDTIRILQETRPEARISPNKKPRPSIQNKTAIISQFSVNAQVGEIPCCTDSYPITYLFQTSSWHLIVNLFVDEYFLFACSTKFFSLTFFYFVFVRFCQLCPFQIQNKST